MTAAAITNKVLKFNQAEAIPAATAVDATDGALITPNASDEKVIILLENASASVAKTATIKAGNGFAGTSDLSVALPASAKYAIVVESGKFVNASGTNRGKIVVTGTDANVKVGVLVTP